MDGQDMQDKTITPMFFALALLYLFTRLYGLTSLPIFTDESIYINLSQKVADNPWHPFLFRMEGKQPLFFWLNALTLNIFTDPLIAGRVVSVVAGLMSMTGIYLIGRNLFSENHGLISAFIYVFCPYTLFFDRLALVDSLLSACGAWMALVSLLAVRKTNSRHFIALGLMMGLAFYVKSTALLLIPVPVFILLLFECRKSEEFWKYFLLSGLVAGMLIAPIYLFGEKVGYFERTELLQIPNRLALTFDELMSFPWLVWWRNVVMTLDFFAAYFTWPLVLLAVFASISSEKKNIALGFWAVFPAIAIDSVANGFFSRYFLIAVPPLILLSTTAILKLTKFMAEKTKLLAPHSSAVLGIFMLVVLSDGFFLRGNCLKIP
jgi:4-amino-4-deoxy-L-arabinose transferase-like glycosyltransferase